MPPGTIEHWQALVQPEHASLIEAAAAIETIEPSAIAALRRRWPAPLVTVALELTRARCRAARKLASAASIVADVTGVEQATSDRVARHKMQRFVELGPPRIIDLCCGIGGDAVALVNAAETIVVDADPVRAWMAARNAGASSRIADVRDIVLDAGDAVHVDPDRRPHAGRRVWRYEDYEPGPEFLATLLDARRVAIKLGPGVHFDALPSPEATEVELVSEDGRLVQAVLWSGPLCRRPGERSATRVPDGVSLHGRPTGTPTRAGPEFDAFLCVPDAALERAGLVAIAAEPLGLAAPSPGPGLLTAAAPVVSPWFTVFEVVAQMPWRSSSVRRWLAEHDAGPVEVKTRGGAVNTDRTQRELRGAGDVPFTVFVLRMGTAVRAVITRRGRNS